MKSCSVIRNALPHLALLRLRQPPTDQQPLDTFVGIGGQPGAAVQPQPRMC